MNSVAPVAPDALVHDVLALPRPTLLAFDVDGTLAPIVPNPEDARVPEPTQRALRRLTVADGVSVALITGRDGKALLRMIELPGAWRALEHGRVVVEPGRLYEPAPLSDPDAARLERFATAVSASGAEVERKAASVGAHFRAMGDDAAASARTELLKVAAELGLHVRDGRAVLEAELESGNKGDALARIHAASGSKSVVFLGDDLTDFPAIEYAAERGVGVFVRSAERAEGPSNALVLDGESAVEAFVATLSLRT